MSNRVSRALKNVTVTYLCATLAWPANLWAGTPPPPPQVVATNAPVSQAATTYTAPNGVPVINIATPNDKGLSHNLWSQFNVPTQGTVLNNATVASRSLLAGTLRENPNLTNGSATVILNEVLSGSSSQASELLGYLEVLGAPADVIIANPNGITCNGCGFINTPRAVLTTGSPLIDGLGNLTGFGVRGGSITIGPNGLDASTIDRFDLVTRNVSLQGPLFAKDLGVFLGVNDFDYANRSVTAAGGGVGTTPGYALDSTLLGGMYADRIRLIATEQGVGVHALGAMATQVDDISISAAGQIELQGNIQAARDVSIAYRGAATANGISTSGDASHFLYGARDVSLDAGTGVLDIGTGSVVSGRDLALAADHIAIDAPVSGGAAVVNVSSGRDLSITAIGSAGVRIGDANVVAGHDGTLSADVIALGGTALQLAADNNLTLTAPGTVTLGAGQVSAGRDLAVHAGDYIDFGGATDGRSAGGDLLVQADGASGSHSLTLGDANYQASGSLALSADTIAFDSASLVLSSGHAMTLDATTSIQMTGGSLFAGTDLTLTAPSITSALAAGTAGDAAAYRVAGGNLSVIAAGGTVDLGGGLFSSVGTAAVSGSTVSIGQACDPAAPGCTALVSGGQAILAADQTLTLNHGAIQAGGDLTMSASTLIDNGTGSTDFRGAGGVLSLSTSNGIALNGGQVYDGAKALVMSAPTIEIGNCTPPCATTKLSGAYANGASGLYLAGYNGVTVGASGSVQSAGEFGVYSPSITFRDGSDIAANGRVTLSDYGQLSMGGALVAGGDLLLRPDVAAYGPVDSRVTSTGSVQTYGLLSLRGNDPSSFLTGVTLTIEAGDSTKKQGELLADGFSVYADQLVIGECQPAGVGCNTDSKYYAALQGGTEGGTLTVNQFKMNNANSYTKFVANTTTGPVAATTLTVNGDLKNTGGLLFAIGDFKLNIGGNVYNGPGGAISSAYGDLSVLMTGSNTTFFNDAGASVIAGNNLSILFPNGGTLWNESATNPANRPTGTGTHGPAMTGTAGQIYSSFGNITLGSACNPYGAAWNGTMPSCDPLTTPNVIFVNHGDVIGNSDITIVARNFANTVGYQQTTSAWTDKGADFISFSGTLNGVPIYVSGDSGNFDQTGPRSGRVGSFSTYDYGVSYLAPGWGGGSHQQQTYQECCLTGTVYSDFSIYYTQSQINTFTTMPGLISGGGTVRIVTQNGVNRGSTIQGYNVIVESLDTTASDPGVASGTGVWVNTDITHQYWDSSKEWGRAVWTCRYANGNLNPGCADPVTSGYLQEQSPEYLNTSGVHVPTYFQTVTDLLGTIHATNAYTFNGATMQNVGSVQRASFNPCTTCSTETINGSLPGGGNGGSATPVLPNGVQLPPLPNGPNGLYVVSTDKSKGFVIETNPLYAGATNPFLGSDYLMKALGINPDATFLRLGDGNYEARLIEDQIRAQTGLVVLQSAANAYDQQQMLMDNAVLEAKSQSLTFGVALTASQVANLKHDIVWMVQQVVDGQTVLVPVVYLTDATRAASTQGAGIYASNVVITADSFLNRGGTISGAENLVIVSKQDLVNSSGTLMGGNVALKSLQGDIVNRTETMSRTESGGDYFTEAGKNGGIYASQDLFMKSARDINIQGATVDAGGNAVLVAGRDVNIDAIVLSSRSSNKVVGGVENANSVTEYKSESQSANASSVTANGNVVIQAQNNINVTGSLVGSSNAETVLNAVNGDVNIKTQALDSSSSMTSTSDGFVTSGKSDAAAGTATAFAGYQHSEISETESSTTHQGSLIVGKGVSITAGAGNVNIEGSDVIAGTDGLAIKAAKDINITAVQDTYSSTSNSDVQQFGMVGNGSADGANAGFQYRRDVNNSTEDDSLARTSSLTSGGSVALVAGNKLTNQGTTVDAGGDIYVKAQTVENDVATSTTSSTGHSEQDTYGLTAGVTTNGMGQSIKDLADGKGGMLVVAAPQAQVQLSGSTSVTDTTSSSSTVKTTEFKAGGSIGFDVAGDMTDTATKYTAGKDIIIDAGSYTNKAAANTSSSTSNNDYGGGSVTVGVDATSNVNASVAGYGGTSSSSDSASTAVTGSFTAGGSVVIRSKGDVNLEGTSFTAGKDVGIDAAGDLNFKQATSSASSTSSSVDASGNLSGGACLDGGCASGGAGGSGTTSDKSSSSTTGVAGSINAGGNVVLKSGGDMTLEGTNVKSGGDTALLVGGNLDFKALTSTETRTGDTEGGSAQVGAGGGSGTASGNVNGTWQSDTDNYDATTKTGGSIAAGGNLVVQAGGNAHLEGTQITATNAAVDVKGNFTMESAQSTVTQDTSTNSGSFDASASKGGGTTGAETGGQANSTGENAGGGSVTVNTGSVTKDNLTNQNAHITTTGSTVLNVGGDATLAGARIDAGSGLSGNIGGNLSIESRTDQIKETDSSIKVFAGAEGLSSMSGSASGDMTTGQKVDHYQGRLVQGASAVTGSGLDVKDVSSSKDDVTLSEASGISGGSGGLSGLNVGGNVTLKGASTEVLGAKINGTVTQSDVETHTNDSSTDVRAGASLAMALGRDPGKVAQINGPLFRAGGSSPARHNEEEEGARPAARPTEGEHETPATPRNTRAPATHEGGEPPVQNHGESEPVTRPVAVAPERPPSGGSVRPASHEEVDPYNNVETPPARPSHRVSGAPEPERLAPQGGEEPQGIRPPTRGTGSSNEVPSRSRSGSTVEETPYNTDAIPQRVVQNHEPNEGNPIVPRGVVHEEPTEGSGDYNTDEVVPRPSVVVQDVAPPDVPAPNHAQPEPPASNPAAHPSVPPAPEPSLPPLYERNYPTVAHDQVTGKPTFEMSDLGYRYRGEQDGTSTFSERFTPPEQGGQAAPEGNRTVYLTREQRAQYEVEVRQDGLLYYKAGPNANKPVHTGNHEEGAIFVMDGEGRLYASTESVIGRFHHSSLLGGEPVAMAGHMLVENGHLLYIDNASGHYQPTRQQYEQMLGFLQHDQHLNMSQTRVAVLARGWRDLATDETLTNPIGGAFREAQRQGQLQGEASKFPLGTLERPTYDTVVERKRLEEAARAQQAQRAQEAPEPVVARQLAQQEAPVPAQHGVADRPAEPGVRNRSESTGEEPPYNTDEVPQHVVQNPVREEPVPVGEENPLNRIPVQQHAVPEEPQVRSRSGSLAEEPPYNTDPSPPRGAQNHEPVEAVQVPDERAVNRVADEEHPVPAAAPVRSRANSTVDEPPYNTDPVPPRVVAHAEPIADGDDYNTDEVASRPPGIVHAVAEPERPVVNHAQPEQPAVNPPQPHVPASNPVVPADSVPPVYGRHYPAIPREEGTGKPKFEMSDLGYHFRGEQDGNAAFSRRFTPPEQSSADPAPEGNRTVYLTRDQRAQYEVEVRQDGLLYYKAGPNANKPVHTGNHEEGAIFVMDGEGRLYASTESVIGRFHHSSLLGGEPVAMAGHMLVENGHLLYIDNASGHYQPTKEQYQAMLGYLEHDQHVDLSQTRVAVRSNRAWRDPVTDAELTNPLGGAFHEAQRQGQLQGEASKFPLGTLEKPSYDTVAVRKRMEEAARAEEARRAQQPAEPVAAHPPAEQAPHQVEAEHPAQPVFVPHSNEPAPPHSEEASSFYRNDDEEEPSPPTHPVLAHPVQEPVAPPEHHDQPAAPQPEVPSSFYRDDNEESVSPAQHPQPHGEPPASEVPHLAPHGVLSERQQHEVQVASEDYPQGRPHAMQHAQPEEQPIPPGVDRMALARIADEPSPVLPRDPHTGRAELKVKALLGDYQGERTGTAKYSRRFTPTEQIDGPAPEGNRTVYLDAEQRKSFEVEVRADGRLYYKAGPNAGKRLHTGAHKDGAIFVMDGEGRLYASNEAVVGRFHHSSFLGGEPVAMAGHMLVDDGRLVYFDNVSGHYAPSREHAEAMRSYLEHELHADLSGTRMVATDGRWYADLSNGNYLGGSPRKAAFDLETARGHLQGEGTPFPMEKLARPNFDDNGLPMEARAQRATLFEERDAAQQPELPVEHEGALPSSQRERSGTLNQGANTDADEEEVPLLRRARSSTDPYSNVQEEAPTEPQAVRQETPSRRSSTEPYAPVRERAPTQPAHLTESEAPTQNAPRNEYVQGQRTVGEAPRVATKPLANGYMSQANTSPTRNDEVPLDWRIPVIAKGSKPLPVSGRSGSPKLVTKSLEADYVGESKGKGEFSRRFRDPQQAKKGTTPPESRTKYLTSSERAKFEVEVRNDGRLYYKAGPNSGTRLDTGDHPAGAIFVMDEKGRLYVSTEAVVGRFHHSSFLGGKPVAMAGHMLVEDGRLLYFDNASGHYHPSAEQLNQMHSVLQHQLHADLSQTRIAVLGLQDDSRWRDAATGKELLVHDPARSAYEYLHGEGRLQGEASRFPLPPLPPPAYDDEARPLPVPVRKPAPVELHP